MGANKHAKGVQGEDMAVEYLKKKGYRIIERNFRFERGEVDVVAEDGDALVFIEVKSRRSKSFGAPHEAVTRKKQMQIRKVAGGYLFEKEVGDHYCRFDIIAIQYSGDSVKIEHFEDAF